MIARPELAAFKDDLHDSFEARSVHIHQELHEFFARSLLRAVRHLVELRDQLPSCRTCS